MIRDISKYADENKNSYINFELFAKICAMKQKKLKKYLEKELVKLAYVPMSKNGFLYAEGSIPILLVAHLDTVHKRTPKVIGSNATMTRLTSASGLGADDRAGVYAILQLISKVKCHVLFCQDEEKGLEGAFKFIQSDITENLDKHLNLILEFDHIGKNNAVFYSGEESQNNDFVQFICSFGFDEEPEWKGRTDIWDICPQLSTAGVNLPCGYYDIHTKDEYLIPEELNATIVRAYNIIMSCNKRYEYMFDGAIEIGCFELTHEE